MSCTHIDKQHGVQNILFFNLLTDSAPPGESSNLLDELELMKKIKPHNNIINLLGCCTTPGMGSHAVSLVIV